MERKMLKKIFALGIAAVIGTTGASAVFASNAEAVEETTGEAVFKVLLGERGTGSKE